MDVSIEFNFLHTKIYIIHAVKWVFALSEYTKIDVSWCTGGNCSAPPSPLAAIKGPLRSRTGMKGRTIVEGRKELVERRGRREGGGKW